MNAGIAGLEAPDGVVVGAAADHRDSLRDELARRDLTLDDAAIGAIKARIAEVLASVATVLLLDVESGLPAAQALGLLERGLPVALPLEDQGYGDVARVAVTTLSPGFSPGRAAELGAAACKLLLPFRTDVADQAARQEDVAAGCAEACREAGLPLVLEPIVYRRSSEALGTAQFGELVVAGAERLARLDPGLLKLQYPGSRSACDRLHTAAGAQPWVLLGGGAEPETLERQVGEACAAGARGFIVGRTLWSDALVADPAERERRIATFVRPRLERLAAIARAHRPATTKEGT